MGIEAVIFQDIRKTYGAYSLIHSLSGKILNFCMVHLGIVKNPLRMELRGMKNCIEDLKNQQNKINNIINDRHPQTKLNVP